MIKPLPITGNASHRAWRTQRNSNRCFRFLLLLVACCGFGFFQQTQAQTVVTIGNGTQASGANVLFSTNTGGNLWSKSATLYTAQEITTAGGTAGLITKIAWNKQGSGEYTNGNAHLDIYIKQVSKSNHSTSSLNWPTELGTATLVYSTTSLSFMTGTGWQEFTLQTPFAWDGASNLEVYTAFHHPTTLTASMTWEYTVVPGMNLARVGSTLAGTETLIAFDNRPNVRFTLTPASACTSPPNPGTVTSSSSTVCAGSDFTLTLNGFSFGTGQTYQWETSTDGTNWTPIAGATGSSVTTSQTVTSFYRNSVTCGTSTVSSPPIQVTTRTAMSGIFTINGANPTAGTNFQTFTEAMNALSCAGISAAVTFNVAAGTYNEQFVIQEVSGASATNTITINGNNATLSANPVSGNRDMIRLDGADYVTISNLNIETTGTGTSDYGWGIHFMNEANNNTISNNNITIGSLSTTESNSVGILFGSSSTSVTTTGGNNGNNNVISGNTITGAFKGIHMHGVATNPGNNQVINNTIKDFYSEGIEVNGLNGTLIEGNNISRPTRATVGAFYAIYLGGAAQNTVVSKNRIFNSHGAATDLSGNVFGIYSTANDAPAGSENIVKNNLIYDINNATGNINGLYNSGSNGVYYYNNTIVLDNPNHTGIARGLYQTTLASNLKLINNNIVITTGGAAANLQAIYLNIATTTLESDNNNLYVPTGNIGYLGSNHTTLADWRLANTTSPYDMNSVTANPFFANAAAGNFQPTNGVMNNIGQPLAAVTDDITGAARNTTNPDPGAYEFTPSALDLGILALLAPGNQDCYGSATPVTLAIRNFGSSAVDFSTTNTTVSIPVTGPGAPVTLTFVINNNSLNGGQPLAAGDTLIVPVGTLDMSAPGTYVIDGSIAATNDGNTANNTLAPVTLTVDPLVAGTASASQTNFCAGNTVLTLTGSTGGNIQWQQSASASGPFTDIPGATSASYAVSNLNQTSYFQAVVSCGTNSATSNVVNITANTVTATGASRCGFGQVTLNASATTGTINWFDQPAGGTALDTGNTFTPTVSATTTYYAAAISTGATVSVGPTTNTIGSTSSSATNIYYQIFDVFAPLTITSVYVYPTAAGNVVLQIRDNTGAALHTVTVPVTSADINQKTLIPINYSLTPGTGYRIGWQTGGVGLLRNGGGAVYPYTIPGLISVTGNSFTNQTYWYGAYDWQIQTSCESARVPVVATVTPADQITVSGSRDVCSNSTTTLTASSTNANYTYTWSPATGLNQTTGATVIANPGVTTQYIVTGTDGTCTDVDTVTINVTPIAAGFTTGFAALCAGDSTLLSLQGYAGNIQWQRYNGTAWVNETGTGATTALYKIQPTQASQYRAVVSNGACTPVISDTVNIAVGLPAVVTSTPDTICGNVAATLSATASEGDVIQWFSAATGGTALASGNTFSATPTTTTTYYAEAGRFRNAGKVGPVSNAIGAGAYGNFSNQMVFDALQPIRIDFIKLYSDGPMSFKIFLRDMVDGNKLDSAFVVLPGAGEHRVPVGFEVMPGTGYSIGIPNYSGPGQLYRNTAGTAFPYTLPGVVSITGSNFSPATARYYYFYDWNVSTIGCTSARTAVTATVTPAPVVSLGADTTVCGTASIVLDAGNAGLTFEWLLDGNIIPSATSQTYTATAAGTYSVNVTSPNGCVGTDAIVVTVNPKPATPTITRSGPANHTLTSSAATGNQWLRNGQPISGATAQTYQATSNGAYAVVVTTNSCASDTSAVVNITNTGIKGNFAGMSVSVYPNPSKGNFNVKLTGYKHEAAIELYSLTGQLIVKENVKAGQEVTSMEVKNLAAGTYMLKVVSEKGVQVSKLIVE